jgi:hypothetical protein
MADPATSPTTPSGDTSTPFFPPLPPLPGPSPDPETPPWKQPSTGSRWKDIARDIGYVVSLPVTPQAQEYAMSRLQRREERLKIDQGRASLEYAQWYNRALQERERLAREQINRYYASQGARPGEDPYGPALMRGFGYAGVGAQDPSGFGAFPRVGGGVGAPDSPQARPDDPSAPPPAAADPGPIPPYQGTDPQSIDPSVSPYRERLRQSPQFQYGAGGVGGELSEADPGVPGDLRSFAQPYPGGPQPRRPDPAAVTGVGSGRVSDVYGPPIQPGENVLQQAVDERQSAQNIDPQRARQQQEAQAQQNAYERAAADARASAAPAVGPSGDPAPVPTEDGTPGGTPPQGGGGAQPVGAGAAGGAPGAPGAAAGGGPVQAFGGMGASGGMGLGGGGIFGTLPANVYQEGLRRAEMVESLGDINAPDFPTEASNQYQEAWRIRDNVYRAQATEFGMVQKRAAALANAAHQALGISDMPSRRVFWQGGGTPPSPGAVNRWAQTWGVPPQLSQPLAQMEPTWQNLQQLISTSETREQAMKEAVQNADIERKRAAAQWDRTRSGAEPEILRLMEERIQKAGKSGAVSQAEIAHFENTKDVYGAVTQVLQDIANTPGAIGVLGIGGGVVRWSKEHIESLFNIADPDKFARNTYEKDLAALQELMATVLRKTGRGTNQQERDLIRELTDAKRAMLGVTLPINTLQTLQRNVYRLMVNSPAYSWYYTPQATSADEETNRRIHDWYQSLQVPPSDEREAAPAAEQ